MEWREISDAQLGSEKSRLQGEIRRMRELLDEAESEQSRRRFGLAIGETVTINGVEYVRVWSPYMLKLRKVTGKAGRYAYHWNEWKAGTTATPW